MPSWILMIVMVVMRSTFFYLISYHIITTQAMVLRGKLSMIVLHVRNYFPSEKRSFSTPSSIRLCRKVEAAAVGMYYLSVSVKDRSVPPARLSPPPTHTSPH